MDTISSSPQHRPDQITSTEAHTCHQELLTLGALSNEMLWDVAFILDDTSTALLLSDLNIIFECCSICLLLRTRMFAMRAGKFWRRVRHCWDVSRAVPSAECLLSVVTLRCVVTSSPLLTSQSQYRIFITWDRDCNDHCTVSHHYISIYVLSSQLALLLVHWNHFACNMVRHTNILNIHCSKSLDYTLALCLPLLMCKPANDRVIKNERAGNIFGGNQTLVDTLYS